MLFEIIISDLGVRTQGSVATEDVPKVVGHLEVILQMFVQSYIGLKDLKYKFALKLQEGIEEPSDVDEAEKPTDEDKTKLN